MSLQIVHTGAGYAVMRMSDREIVSPYFYSYELAVNWQANFGKGDFMSKIGDEIFMRDWKVFNELDEESELPMSIKQSFLKPVSKMHRRINKAVEHWLVFVAVTIGFFTMKVLIETIVERLR